MARPPGTFLRVAALLGLGLLAALLVLPAQAPATRRQVPPIPVLQPAPEGGVIPAPGMFAPLPVRRVLLPVPVVVEDARIHRIAVPPPLPPRLHRLHLIPPTLALTEYEPAGIPSDAAAPLYLPSPETGQRMGAPQLLTPGALPDGFRYHYDDSYTGWPVQPLHGLHALHGAFNDPREGGYHFGVDIAVDDSKPALQAPAGMSHRVYAVESGTVHYTRHGEMSVNCNDRRFQIGHFSYWHVSPLWVEGTEVNAGDLIGWSCLNEWHVHLSEWALVNGQRVWVNPLHRGGKLQPYVDDVKPVIRAVYAYGPPAEWWAPTGSGQLAAADGASSLALDNLHGAVDLRAWIDDSQGNVGIYRDSRRLGADLSPYRVWVQIRRVEDGAIVWQRNVWQSDMLLTGHERLYAHYGAHSRATLSDFLCVHTIGDCAGRLFYHLVVSDDRYLWDTSSVRDGDYVLTIRAFDVNGNMGERQLPLAVRN
ncbi:MAG TPA: hypothetical protein VFD90_07210 [Gaiellales bacterium]|jgi:hypothetical protein|nr:hypothetical protein [Gaiellales bacterium]